MFSLFKRRPSAARLRRPQRPRSRLCLQPLEDRMLLTTLTPVDFGANMTSTPVAMNGVLYFTADDNDHGSGAGYELFRSDGTAAGTYMVKDINPGAGSSMPANLTNVNGTLFFTANDGVHGAELFHSDGTAAGTYMVKDINPGSAGATVG